MSREIKFRAWDGKHMTEWGFIKDSFVGPPSSIRGNFKTMNHMQFTGLHDKNSLKELYEGDIIDADGNLKGNIYESPQIYEEGIDCLIEGMGTEKWRSTESIAMGRGCKYTK